jgi:hypothetical protein
LFRHQDALTFILPDVNVKVDKCVFEVKQPSELASKERITLLAVLVSSINLNVNISQSSSNLPHTSSKSDGSRDSNNANNTGSAVYGDRVKSLRGFASLSGALIQFRFVIKRFSFSLSVPSNDLPSQHSHLPQNSKSKGENVADLSIMNREEEDEPDGQSVPTSSSHGNGPDFPAVKEIKNTQVKYIPGKTILESMESLQLKEMDSYNDTTSTDNRTSRSNAKPGSTSLSGTDSTGFSSSKVSLETPIDNMKVYRTAESSANHEELREIFCSSESDSFFVFCLILDLDDRSEGAGDLQFQVGSLRGDLSQSVMASLINAEYWKYFGLAGKHYSDIQQALSLLADPMLIVNWEVKVPMIQLLYEPPIYLIDDKSTTQSFREKSERKQKDANGSTEESDLVPDSAASDQNKVPILPEMETDITNEDSARNEALEEYKTRRAANSFNRNFMFWLSLLEQKMPRVLSVCFKTCPVVLQTLESAVIRDLVHAKVQSVIDK